MKAQYSFPASESAKEMTDLFQQGIQLDRHKGLPKNSPLTRPKLMTAPPTKREIPELAVAAPAMSPVFSTVPTLCSVAPGPRMVPAFAHTMRGACSTISNGRKVSRSATV